MLSEKIKSYWKFIPFAWKSILLYIPLFTVVFAFFLFLALHEIKSNSLEQAQKELLAKSEQLSAHDLGSEDFSLIAENCQLVVFNAAAQPLLKLNAFIEANPLQQINQFQFLNRKKVLLYNTFIKIFDETYLVQLAKDRSTEAEILSDLNGFFILIILAALLISATLSIPMTRFSLREIEKMATAAETISYENLETRLELSGSKDEFDTLAATLNQMIDRIQTAAEAQKKFISNASHELRTPIAVIKGYAQLLTRWGAENPETVKESAEAINKEIDSIQMLLQDLLLLTRIDSQLTDLKVEVIDLIPLIEETIKENTLLYPDRDFRLTEATQPPFRMLGDPWLIKGLLRIFTENAVKFSPQGSDVHYSLLKAEDRLQLFIEDHGCGIEDAEKAKVFDRFYRIDESRSREKGGSGLGLAIAKRVIELHKGHVCLSDTPNGGTTVQLSFAAAPGDAVPQSPTAPNSTPAATNSTPAAPAAEKFSAPAAPAAPAAGKSTAPRQEEA